MEFFIEFRRKLERHYEFSTVILEWIEILVILMVMILIILKKVVTFTFNIFVTIVAVSLISEY